MIIDPVRFEWAKQFVDLLRSREARREYVEQDAH